MKNLLLTAFYLTFIFSISSCSNSDEQESVSDITSVVNKPELKSAQSDRTSSEELENFENDEDLRIIISKIPDYKNALEADNIQQVNLILNDIVASAINLKNKYGEDQMDIYFEELIANEGKFFGTHDKDKCTRNLNGTTYWDQCSFWEEVAATLSAAINCPTSNGGPFNDNQYYICVQAAICRNC